jgi:hypothetical protein
VEETKRRGAIMCVMYWQVSKNYKRKRYGWTTKTEDASRGCRIERCQQLEGMVLEILLCKNPQGSNDQSEAFFQRVRRLRVEEMPIA